MSSVLVVEDEPAIAELIAINLRHAGFEVTVAADGAQANAAMDAILPSMVVLDWMLAGESGVSLARQWRSTARTRELPIIMLTARAEEADKVVGLEAGADDYLVKPFSTKELLARIRAVLRRRAPHAIDAAVSVGPLTINPATRRLTGHGREVKINPTEFRLLHYLMTHTERVHSRAQLLNQVWGDHVFIEERTVDVHIKRLRDALVGVRCDGCIETVRGTGYRLTDPSALHSSRAPTPP